MKNVVIFASGSGSNAQNIVEYFTGNPTVNISLIVSNKYNAFVIERARKLKIPVLIITRKMFYNTDQVVDILKSQKTDLVVLAGFLWLIPSNLIKTFPNKIINIHPALLPKYGGKGMYGNHIHKAVKENNEPETGISIHLVNEKYDEGEIIKQVTCSLDNSDTVETIAQKIHALEFQHFPQVIEQLLLNQ